MKQYDGIEKGTIMKEQEIKDILLRNNIQFVPHGTICGSIIAGVGAYNNGMGKFMHMMKDHILHFNQQGIVVLVVDDLTGKVQEDSLLMIAQSAIQSIDLQVKLSKFILIIETDKGEIRYTLHKKVFASPWHKENLSFLLLNSRTQKPKVNR